MSYPAVGKCVGYDKVCMGKCPSEEMSGTPYKQTDRQKERQTDRQKGRQTDRQVV